MQRHILSGSHQVAVGAEDDLGVARKLARRKVGAAAHALALSRQVLDVVHLFGSSSNFFRVQTLLWTYLYADASTIAMLGGNSFACACWNLFSPRNHPCCCTSFQICATPPSAGSGRKQRALSASGQAGQELGELGALRKDLVMSNAIVNRHKQVR